MCIGSNSVNQAQDLMTVTKIEDLPNSLLPNLQPPTLPPRSHLPSAQVWKLETRNAKTCLQAVNQVVKFAVRDF